MKEKVLVARATFPDIIERLEAYFEVERNHDDHLMSPDELNQRLADKSGAMLMGMEKIDGVTINAAPKLRAVSNCAAGYNNFDMAALTQAGIVATNTPEVSNESVADLAWCLLLGAARRSAEADTYIRAGQWQGFAYNLFLGVDLHHTTLGILGMGRIGQAIARRAAGFDMQVVYHNRSRLPADIERDCRAHYVDKDTLFRDSDHVVLTLPYSLQAHHCVGSAQFALMKASATLINVARGGIVDDQALAAALANGTIAAAGLDVFEGEPAVHPDLLQAPNLLMTPHIGSATRATRRALANLAVDNLIASMGYGENAGNPPSLLNPEALSTGRSLASQKP